MKQKLLTLFTLLLTVCSGAWANQTIDDVTVPDIPASTLDMGSQTTYTPDANGWIVFNPYSVTATWWAVTNKSAQTENYTKKDGDGFTAPFVTQTSDTQKINSSGNYAAAIRFTGATDASFLVNPRGNRNIIVAIYTYNGETQTLHETKSCTNGSGFKEILFTSLSETTNYVAYIYTKATSNCTLAEIALKKTVDTTPAAVSITSPASDPELIEITQGQTTTLNITASGYPAPEYQWYRNTSKSTVGATELTGANSASYTTPNNLAVGTWYYYCVADNTSGDPATSPYFSVKVNALGADLTVHEPGIYEKSAGEGGYGQTLKEMEVDEVIRQYEIYAMGSASSANYWFAGTRTTNPSDANCLSTEGFTTSFAASKITGAWMKGEVTARGTSFNTETEEFPAQSSTCYTVKVNTTDKYVMIKVAGYDQIGILGKDNNATENQGKHFVVKINGEEQDMTLSTSYTVRRFSLDPDIESVIEITGSTTGADNHLVGFSLRLPEAPVVPTAPVLSLASSTDVPVLGDIVVKSDVAAAIVSGGTVAAQIKDGETKVADVTGTLSGDGKTLTFDNTTKLAYEKDYTLSIAADVLQNAADPSLKNIAYNLNFTTAAKLSDVTMSDFVSTTSFTTTPSTTDLSLAVSGSQFDTNRIKFRWGNNSFTVTSAAHNIVAMQLTYTVEGDVTPVVNVNTGEFNLASKMWIGNASSVTFTNGYTASSDGNIYISSIKVYYEGSDEEPVPVTITAAGYATFSSTEKLNFTGIDGLTAYKATTTDGSSVTLEDVTGIVPAETGLLLKGAANTYYIPVSTAAATADVTGNKLQSTAKAAHNIAAGEVDRAFVFGSLNEVVGFYKAAAGKTIGVGKSYLLFDAAPAKDVEFLSFVFGDEESETTAIKAVTTAVENGVRYNLAGQKVDAAYKGIVIVNGKKMLNK